MDCFTAELPRAVSLQDYITAFYNSAAFRPERWALHLIGPKLPGGTGGEDVRKLAAGEVDTFAAWTVEARTDTAILMRDFQQRTCSWLAVKAHAGKTRLYFGSGVQRPDGALVKALMPFHRFYAKALLKSAVGALER
ncbi:hypothetical protein GRI35_03295 [Altererythrobacter aestiaquae]|uniref:Polyketide cyclase / dehydrase and lipid transport n=2 Tax=Pontixanthobacter aestiaquae TaxID=1509367 RepID=A0A844Z4X9_9SPHN|nr:hypothetical protein [Pontixanthobacter aestiaquae]